MRYSTLCPLGRRFLGRRCFFFVGLLKRRRSIAGYVYSYYICVWMGFAEVENSLGNIADFCKFFGSLYL